MTVTDFEVIVINDGGAGLDARRARAMWKEVGGNAAFQYHRISNKGLSAAVNRGLQSARGEYYTVLPDDDEMEPKKLSVMCNFLDQRAAVNVAYCLPQYIDHQSEPIKSPSKFLSFQKKHPVLRWDHIKRGHGLVVHATATMYRREAVADVGGWDEKLPTAEEFEYHLRLLHGGHDFHAVPSVLTRYRLHQSNKSTDWRKKRKPYMPYIYGKFFPDKKAPH